MTATTKHASRRPGWAATLTFMVAALIAALVPVAIGLTFLISAAAHRPALVAAIRRWPPAHAESIPTQDALTNATVASGLGLLLIGAAQGVGEVTAGLSIATLTGLATRTGIALLAELALAAAVASYLHRHRVPGSTS